MGVESVLEAVASQTGASVPALRLVFSVLLGKFNIQACGIVCTHKRKIPMLFNKVPLQVLRNILTIWYFYSCK